MQGLTPDEICNKLLNTEGLYHQLVLVVGPAGTGKTAALRAVADRVSGAVINVNLGLSRRLLDQTERQRPLRVRSLLELTVAEHESHLVLLDNIELLFNVALKQDPLRLLQGLSRARKVAAAWNGSIKGGHIHYAEPGHPEYRCYPKDGLLVVNTEAAK